MKSLYNKNPYAIIIIIMVIFGVCSLKFAQTGIKTLNYQVLSSLTRIHSKTANLDEFCKKFY